MNREKFRKNAYMLWLLYIVFYLAFFFIVEKIVSPDSAYWSVHCGLDDVIPFCEYFVIPYYMWYPYLAVIGLYLMFKDKNAFIRYMVFIAITFTSTLVFCLIVPNGQDLRPDLALLGRSNVFTHLMGLIYAADTNTNVMPSMHVLGSAAGIFAVFDSKVFKRKKTVRLIVCIIAVIICVSTVFVKQHSALDAVGGVIVSAVAYVLVYVLIKKRMEKKALKVNPENEASE